MTRQQLTEQIFQKQTYLCVGLDTDLSKIPVHLREQKDALFEFNRQIIDATLEHCVSYKINTAFYEAYGVSGWEAMQRTIDYIPDTHFVIADAKRGDIGNTSSQYARAFFETLGCDAITVAPYMGEDSVRPFLEYKDKWTIVLGLTSNPGARDFELQKIRSERGEDRYLYQEVLQKVASWGHPGNLMFVIGATQGSEFASTREIAREHFFLVPGVGAQGGSLKEISEGALIKDCGLLVNASRAIIYASAGEQFAEEAKAIAQQYHFEMDKYLGAI